MERDKQYSEHSKEENWTEEQEKAYWHEVNKRYEAHHALEYIGGLSAMDIVDTIAVAKGYHGADFFKDYSIPSLVYEIATNTFLSEVRKITAPYLSTKISVGKLKDVFEV